MIHIKPWWWLTEMKRKREKSYLGNFNKGLKYFGKILLKFNVTKIKICKVACHLSYPFWDWPQIWGTSKL